MTRGAGLRLWTCGHRTIGPLRERAGKRPQVPAHHVRGHSAEITLYPLVLPSARREPAPRTGSVNDVTRRLDARTRDAPVGWRFAHGDRYVRPHHQEIW